MNLLAIGDKNRNVASTNMNSTSSRSHAVYMVKLEKRVKVSAEELENTEKPAIVSQSMTRSTLYLVDLAGSERVSKTKVSGSRLDEAKNINLALLALGNCIQALTEGRTKYIPFRDSKLTRLLEDSLGGNSKTSLIVTIGPSVYNYTESVSSMLFGGRAMRIQNNPELNLKIDYKALCAKLQSELDKINDNKNITNIDIDKLVDENNSLKQTIDRLSTDKIQLEDMLEELKKGSDLSIVDGNAAEFKKIQRYYRNKFEKQEQDHKKSLQELDKMLLDQEEQLNSIKNENIELENNNKQLALDLRICQNELEQERNDRNIRASQFVNEVEDLKQQLLVANNRIEGLIKEIERVKSGGLRKSSSGNTLQPIKMKTGALVNPDEAFSIDEMVEKIKALEQMVLKLEQEVDNNERKYEREVTAHKETQNKFANEEKKFKKQQVKLIKAYKSLEKKSESDIRSLQLELEKVSVYSKP